MRPIPTRKALGAAAISSVVFVAGAASAWSSPPKKTTPTTSTASSPAARYFVINGTVNAASDHEILGSSAFPNFTTGAVDNYYSLAHSHVDNAPFAQGTASPADTGPVGQTAAAGSFQQPQYADARWPGDSGKASYGSQGGPYAVATASEYDATAEASVASSGLSGASGAGELAVPGGFDGRLRTALAGWQAKWLDRLHAGSPKATLPTPAAPVPKPPVPVPTTPLGTPAGVPTVTVPAVVPAGIVPQAAPSRSLQSSSSPDGASLLHSTSRTFLDPTTDALVTTGESSLGRVSIGGGQIVLEGIHVTAQIANDGTPTDKETVSVASATIGGVPVTIDEDGVHVAGQAQHLPYRQASDALNAALKQAGVQLFLVAPEVTKGGGSSGGQGTTTTTSTTPLPVGPVGSTSTSTDTTATTTDSTTTTSTDETGTTASGTGACTPTETSTDGGTATDTTGTTTTGTTTGSGPVVPIGSGSGGTGTGTDTSASTDTTSASEETVTATGVHVVFTQPVDAPGVPAQYAEHILGEVYIDSLAEPAGALPNLGLGLGSSSGSSPCGTTGRHAATKTTTTTKSGVLLKGGGSTSGGAPASGSASSASGSPSGFSSGSGSSQQASGVLPGSAQPASSATGTTVPTSSAGFLSTLRKPLWLLVAYLVWQALMLVTGVSVWHWYRGGTS